MYATRPKIFEVLGRLFQESIYTTIADAMGDFAAAGAPAGTFVVPLRATRNGDVAALSNAVEFTYYPGDDADAHECAEVNEAGFS